MRTKHFNVILCLCTVYCIPHSLHPSPLLSQIPTGYFRNKKKVKIDCHYSENLLVTIQGSQKLITNHKVFNSENSWVYLDLGQKNCYNKRLKIWLNLQCVTKPTEFPIWIKMHICKMKKRNKTYIFSWRARHINPCLGEEGTGAKHKEDV